MKMKQWFHKAISGGRTYNVKVYALFAKIENGGKPLPFQNKAPS